MIAVSWGRVCTPQKGLKAPPPQGFDALKDRLHMMAEDIISRHPGVTLGLVMGARRTAEVVRARDEVFWTASQSGASLLQIGRAFNCATHSTVKRAIDRHKKRATPISTLST